MNESKADYNFVEGEVKAKGPKSVRLRTTEGTECWIPFSTIHGADLPLAENATKGDTILIRVMEWLVDKEGL